MTLTVHHLGVSQSDRVVWLCEELGIEYNLKKYDRAPILSPDEYKALHPLGAAPVIEDGHVELAESSACVEYICQIYGKGRFVVAPGQKNYADYLYWFHFVNGTLTPALSRTLALSLAGLGKDNDTLKRYDDKLKQILGFVDERLSKVPWLAGEEITAADITIVCCLTSMRSFYPYDLGEYKNILAYLKRISERDGYRRAVQKGDPDLDIDKLTGAAPPPMQKGLAAALQARGK
ncbi:Uu.00g132390.m01.CDS01 [Anthostomella pinea]|uniref:Uu.00g132390.m01.CDS01 n=1 Tax=Anthostomella pinea TaxID=933095 RepID=A0AAI8VK12_9PEZI|nr:Uu.00g132390.m01.CDS01 [Anthostomella pinea]